MYKIFLALLILAVALRVCLSILFLPHLSDGQQVSFETTLLTEPVNHGSFDRLTVYYTNEFSSLPISVTLPAGNDLHYGQVVAISGRIKVKVLQNKQTITTISMPTFKIDSAKQNYILVASFFLRQKFQELYEKSFSQKLSSLLLGIVLGVKGNFPKEFLVDLQTTGVMHVIAASGMNVTMVGGFFLGLLSMFVRRRLAIALTILVLLFYCMVSGLQASILRATIMIGFALFGQMLGRQYSGFYGLFLAGGLMLLYNPTLVFDVGFQLSFAATLGIFLFKPLLPKWGIITDDIGTTISAQIATLPILVGSFGTYGLLSVVVNALVLWTIPPLMILGGVGGLLGLVFEPLGKLLLYLCLPFLWFFTGVISYFAAFHWQITIPSLPLSLIVGYYSLLGSWVWVARKTKSM